MTTRMPEEAVWTEVTHSEKVEVIKATDFGRQCWPGVAASMVKP